MPKTNSKPQAVVPADLRDALAKNQQAKAAFEILSPSHRREYIKWITEAKRDETRKRRIDAALLRLVELPSRATTS
jgi:uncharacterized protein YdeI (YjbR/CyaY-like superfamily)